MNIKKLSKRELIEKVQELEKELNKNNGDESYEEEKYNDLLNTSSFTEIIIDAMPGVFYIFDPSGKFIKWNKQLAKLSGIPFEEVAKKKTLDFIIPEHHKELQEAIKNAFKKGEMQLEADLLTKKGHAIPFYFTGKRILIENNTYLLGIGIDISKRKKAEKEEEEASEKLQKRIKEITCLFKINEAIKETDIAVPEAMQAICNFIPPGWHIPENTSAEIVLDQKIYRSGNFKESDDFISEKIILDDMEKGHVKVNVINLAKTQLKKPFLKEEKDLLKVIASNISAYIARIEYLTKLRKTSDNLARSNKELEQFAYVASHDLQEPLRMVSSYTQLLERKYKDQLDERANKYIYYAVDGATRMQNLINDLLVFSRISTKGESFEKADANEILDEALKNLSMTIQENDVKVTHDKLPVIEADKSQIERVFYNLVSNAIKFRKDHVNPEIHISALKKGEKWLFSVQDNGIGIEDKFQEKIFVIFQRLHGGDQYKGTGIGLALCKRIINRHGGTIWFESTPDIGTTFYFTIHEKTNLKTYGNN